MRAALLSVLSISKGTQRSRHTSRGMVTSTRIQEDFFGGSDLRAEIGVAMSGEIRYMKFHKQRDRMGVLGTEGNRVSSWGGEAGF